LRRPNITSKPDGTILVERFSPPRRVEHLLVIVTFTILVATGLPQKFHHAGWAPWILGVLGGLDTARSVHRVTGWVLVGQAAIHLSALLIGVLTKKMRLTLLPVPQDLRDAWHNLGYYLGYRECPAELPKFDYRQKFEYFGMLLGTGVMLVTGLVLMYPCGHHLAVAGRGDTSGAGRALERSRAGAAGVISLAPLQLPPLTRGVSRGPEHLHGIPYIGRAEAPPRSRVSTTVPGRAAY